MTWLELLELLGDKGGIGGKFIRTLTYKPARSIDSALQPDIGLGMQDNGATLLPKVYASGL